MIIYQSGIITLDYNPATDILFVEWPDVQEFVMPEVRQALSILVDHIRNYDVKRLLVDARNAVVDVKDVEYKAILTEFGQQLMATRLQKMARVRLENPDRDKTVQQAKEDIRFTVTFRDFAEKAAAVEWLLEG